jgi:hypothetical protein
MRQPAGQKLNSSRERPFCPELGLISGAKRVFGRDSKAIAEEKGIESEAKGLLPRSKGLLAAQKVFCFTQKG